MRVQLIDNKHGVIRFDSGLEFKIEECAGELLMVESESPMLIRPEDSTRIYIN